MDGTEDVGTQRHRIEDLTRPYLDADGSPAIRPAGQVEADLGPASLGNGDIALTGPRSLSARARRRVGPGAQHVQRRQHLDPTRPAELFAHRAARR